MSTAGQKVQFGEGELRGRAALVTGASRNIGRAIALALAEGGASVIVHGRSDRAALAEVVGAIEAMGGKAVAAMGDLTRQEDVVSVVEQGVKAFGRLDVLVNNAAVRTEVPFEDMTFTAWRDAFALALDAPFLCIKAALSALERSDQAAIVNIGGMTAYTGGAQRAHVIAAKAGLDGLTKALAHDLSPRGITVNLVSPGMIETVRAGKPPQHHSGASTLVGRRGAPEEIAAMVRFLSGPAARYITGQTLHLNGGAYLA